MKLKLILLFFSFCFLSAAEKDAFFIQHRLGKLSACKADAEKRANLRSSAAVFLKDINLDLKKDRVLKSDLGVLDLETQDLDFHSLSGRVCLQSPLTGHLLPFRLSAQKAFFHKKQPNIQNEFEEKIIFQEQTELKIAEKFTITADSAEYSKNKLVLLSDKNSCKFQSSDKTILSKKVFYDLKKGSLFLEDVQGRLKNIPLKTDETINLSSGKLTVAGQGKKILLEEGVKISHSGGAELVCDSLELDYNNKKIARIVTSANSKVFFKTPAPAIFTSLGPITIDLACKTISTEEKGIVYKEKDTLIVAKKAFLKFKDIKNLSDIENIVLEKDVHFFSSKFKNKNNLGLADRLRFDLISKTLTLESFPANKVIFWEEASALSLSASKIQIQKRGKEEIKGFGNVRLSLKKDEEKLFETTLHKYLLEKPSPRL